MRSVESFPLEGRTAEREARCVKMVAFYRIVQVFPAKERR